ncbi:hypothetical protein GQX73_g2316 [Xylaria multiplex]|uniref:Uncharacterized protein n=1 Tax=Xylaria multiplex TaxID=323545 RepID=A0A7C8NB91_9PEZI|nr:hypothetical protein GQX73_g2316 [Xylaria multiplex]
MAEPLSWLKLGPRARTPSIPLSTNSVEGKVSHDSQPSDPRRPASSRMSSHDTEPSPTTDSAAHLLIRSQDQVWYNPSLDQMVEALQVLLMENGVLHPIPIQYNSYVLHLVEGFAAAQENIRKAETAYRELKQSLEHNFEQFCLVADDWLERESQYRAEVKRLEVLLSKSSKSGLEAVALARTNSIVDRSGSKGGGFLSRLDKLRKHYVNDLMSPSNIISTDQAFRTETPGGPSEKDVPTPKILDNDNDFRISEKIRQQDAGAVAPATTLGERRAYRRGEALQFESDIMKRYQDGFHNPFLPTTTTPVAVSEKRHIHQEAQSSTETHWRDEVPIGLLSSRGPYHRVNCPSKSIISIDDPTIHAGGAATTKTVSRHERDLSDFSFKTGDDFDALPDKPTEAKGRFDLCYREQASSYSTRRSPEGMVLERFERYAGDTDGLATISTSSKEWRLSKDNDGPIQPPPSDLYTVSRSPSVKPKRMCRNSDYSTHTTTLGGSPIQSSHGLDSPLATSATGREVSQRLQPEMDARIAATLALANGLGTTIQKR